MKRINNYNNINKVQNRIQNNYRLKLYNIKIQ